jgi:hypothetical protein
MDVDIGESGKQSPVAKIDPRNASVGFGEGASRLDDLSPVFDQVALHAARRVARDYIPFVCGHEIS